MGWCYDRDLMMIPAIMLSMMMVGSPLLLLCPSFLPSVRFGPGHTVKINRKGLPLGSQYIYIYIRIHIYIYTYRLTIVLDVGMNFLEAL